MATALIVTDKITKEYQTESVLTRVLNGVSVQIDQGEFVSIMGPSGSGKSTLMHILGFLDRPTAGVYQFEGKRADEFDEDELAQLRNQRIGFVFQAFNLLPRTSAIENVCLPLIYAGISGGQETERGTKALERVGLGHRIHHKPNQLSGGEQQRVAIARALINNPSVIFADEPTGNLDTKASQEIIKIFQELNREGHTIVLVTHELDIAQHTKRILTLRDGQIVKDERITQHVL